MTYKKGGLRETRVSDFKNDLILFLESPKTKNQIAKRFDKAVGTIHRCSICLIAVALYSLIDDGLVHMSKSKRKGYPLVFTVKQNMETKHVEVNEPEENEPEVIDGSFETLQKAINNFLSVQKDILLLEITEDQKAVKGEVIYFKNLCEEYKSKIDMLESKQAKGWLKF